MDDLLMIELDLMRTSLFYGRPGCGKTLSAIAIAKKLLAIGMVDRVYANLPLSFAVSPPDHIRDFSKFDFQADYARNSAFLIDEAWIGLMDFDRGLIKKMFAYPRHNNQFFLLTSVLPLRSIEAYCFHYVTMKFNGNKFGLPFRWLYSKIATYKESTNFYLVREKEYYKDYDTTYNAKHVYPVGQTDQVEKEAIKKRNHEYHSIRIN